MQVTITTAKVTATFIFHFRCVNHFRRIISEELRICESFYLRYVRLPSGIYVCIYGTVSTDHADWATRTERTAFLLEKLVRFLFSLNLAANRAQVVTYNRTGERWGQSKISGSTMITGPKLFYANGTRRKKASRPSLQVTRYVLGRHVFMTGVGHVFKSMGKREILSRGC